MIPPFEQATGLLPPTSDGRPYLASPDEVREAFVVGLGSPAWRERIFDGWNLVRRVVSDSVPTARWWLWGCFISSHPTAQFGDAETVTAVVVLPVDDLPTEEHEMALLLTFLQGVQKPYHVDVSVVFDHGQDDPDASDALEQKYRPRATMGVPDHRTGELVRAGFIEVSG